MIATRAARVVQELFRKLSLKSPTRGTAGFESLSRETLNEKAPFERHSSTSLRTHALVGDNRRRHVPEV